MSDTVAQISHKLTGWSRLTREEREEAYKLARERIFGSADDNAAGKAYLILCEHSSLTRA